MRPDSHASLANHFFAQDDANRFSAVAIVGGNPSDGFASHNRSSKGMHNHAKADIGPGSSKALRAASCADRRPWGAEERPSHRLGDGSRKGNTHEVEPRQDLATGIGLNSLLTTLSAAS